MDSETIATIQQWGVNQYQHALGLHSTNDDLTIPHGIDNDVLNQIYRKAVILNRAHEEKSPEEQVTFFSTYFNQLLQQHVLFAAEKRRWSVYNRLRFVVVCLVGVVMAGLIVIYLPMISLLSFIAGGIAGGIYWFFRSQNKKIPVAIEWPEEPKSAFISAPDTEPMEELTPKLLEFASTRVDNPGQGNCMFYAFAIGLINIIQQEHLVNKTVFFNQWLALDPTVQPYFDKIVAMDLQHPDVGLLKVLQRQLRQLIFDVRIKELREAAGKKTTTAWLSNSTYMEFAGYFFENTVRDSSNPFSGVHLEVVLPAKNGRTEAEYDQLKLRVFLNFLYGALKKKKIDVNTPFLDNSPIVAALEQIKQEGHWGTYSDLNVLAELFKVNLHVYENRRPRFEERKDIPTQHTMNINNEANMHWTTQITVARFKTSAPADFQDQLRNVVWKKEEPAADSGILDTPSKRLY